jgi:hypothetical protein
VLSASCYGKGRREEEEEEKNVCYIVFFAFSKIFVDYLVNAS